MGVPGSHFFVWHYHYYRLGRLFTSAIARAMHNGSKSTQCDPGPEMNTQTHILLASALFAQPGQPVRNTAVVAGAIVPDASIFVMWGYGRLVGASEERIWGEFYWLPQWQEVSAITNSLPLFAGLLVLGFFTGSSDVRRTSTLPFADAPCSGMAMAVIYFSLAALVHIATDLPLHVHDGHPPFWPFSDVIFRSAISYWDPQYHGNIVSLAEMLLAASLVILLWRCFRSRIVRSVLILAIVSYGVVALHWATSFST